MAESPLDPKGTWKDEFIGHCETFFLAVFTCELVLKIISMGFLFPSHSYLRDVWCQLDFVVVTLAWVPIFLPSFAQYSFIRVMRALRCLRTLRFLPGMPVLIGSIFKSILGVRECLRLCSFIFLIFGIVGEQQQRKHMHAATAHTQPPLPFLTLCCLRSCMYKTGEELFEGALHYQCVNPLEMDDGSDDGHRMLMLQQQQLTAISSSSSYGWQQHLW